MYLLHNYKSAPLHFLKNFFRINFIVIVFFMMIPSMNAVAQWDFDNSGGRIFDMRKNTSKSVHVTIESVDPKNIYKACDNKSKQFGFGGFKYEPLACAFWRGDKCHIIMPHKIDMRSIGHEIMHCFQGDWHQQPIK